MIFVDSSVWIDYLNGKNTPQPDWLDSSLGSTLILMGDPVFTEVLKGFENDKDFGIAQDLLSGMPFMTMGGRELSIQSALNFRMLRAKVFPEKDDRHNDMHLLYSLPVSIVA